MKKVSVSGSNATEACKGMVAVQPTCGHEVKCGKRLRFLTFKGDTFEGKNRALHDHLGCRPERRGALTEYASYSVS